VAIAVRASSLLYVNNAISGNVAVPAGAVAGDICYVMAGHGFAVSSVVSPGAAGWSQISNLTGGNYNGACYAKVLEAADIAAGTITVNFTGAYYGSIAALAFVGAAATVRTFVEQRSGAGVTTRTLTTDASPQVGDYAVYFGSGRGNTAVTSANGAALQSQSALESSSVLTGGVLAAAGSFGNAFNFAVAPNGDYEIVLVLKEVAAISPGLGYDPTRKTNQTIGNFGAKATSTGAGTAQLLRTLQGKAYMEFTPSVVTGTPSCGLLGSAGVNSTTTDLQSSTFALAYLASGAVRVNNVTLQTIAAWVAGNRIGMAVDPANRLVWFRVNGGNWNNNVANNPATGVGGIDFTAAMTNGGTLVPAIYASLTGTMWDIVTETAQFIDAAPAGFSDIAAVQYTRADSVSAAAHPIPLTTGMPANGFTASTLPKSVGGKFFTPAGAVTVVSGTTLEAGVLVAGKRVDVYDRDTGELLGSTRSDVAGNWSVPCLGRVAVRVVGSDPTTYNSVVYDNVVPV
jgi:hypothetical protein